MTEYIDVAAAAIRNARGDVLIAKRAAHRHQGDRWEFPGGKLEVGEPAAQALIRELQEELGITPTEFHPLITVRHDYGDKRVCLHVFQVQGYTGSPHGREGQPLAWVAPAALSDYAFPAANLPIVKAVQLPECLLVTPEPGGLAAFLMAIERACSNGIRMLQLRAHALSDSAYRQLATEVHAITAHHGTALLLNRSPAVIADLPCEGWHLNRHVARTLQESSLLARPRWLSLACHDEQEIARAEALGADFLLVSPVCATASHPGAATLGWPRFAALCALANRPVYALGGVAASDLETVWQHGGRGIAAIRALWPY